MDIPHGGSLSFGPFRLDPLTESVWRDADEIRLRPKTFAVLKYLADRPRRLVTKEELLEAVWPEVVVGDAALAVCVGEIRKLLGDDAQIPRFVETIHRRGYRFIGSVPASGIAAAAPAALAGREAELGRLRARLARALHGERQVVFVTGEPGIGKTALVEAFLAGIVSGDCWVTRGQCLDHHGVGEAYLPILESLTRLARGPDAERVLVSLRQHAPTWLMQMPSLVGPDELIALEPRSAGATRSRMLREMAEALEALAAERPLVLLLEDLHWSDHSTLDLIVAVARRREAARLLLIGTYRPADVIVRGHPLGTVKHELALHDASYELPLELLGEAEVERYLAGRFGEGVARRFAKAIHKRTDGLPLFVVSVAEAFLAQGLLVRTGERWSFAGDGTAVETAIPQGLRQMIEQQFARLQPDEQRLLEAASVPGMIFSAASLAAALEAQVEEVENRCEALARCDQFLGPDGVEEWPDGTVAARYRFRHVLYQQVLYERLPAARRASLHRRVGDREEAAYRARPAERAAVLALHFERSRDAVRAVRYHDQAAEHEVQRCAYPEAIAHLNRGRELLEAVPDESERRRLELGLQMRLGPALIALRGPADAEVEAVYLRARELADHLNDSTRLYQALWGLRFVDFSRGRYGSAREMGERLLALAERESDTAWLLEAHHGLWSTLCAMGETSAAVPQVERGLALYDSTLHSSQGFLYGNHDAGVCGWQHLAVARWLLGYPDRALASLHNAVSLAETLDQPLTTVIALNSAALVYYWRGELAAARRSAEQALALATTGGFQGWLDGAVVLAGVEVRDSGQGGRIAELYQQIASFRPTHLAWRNKTPACLCLLAEASCALGDVEAGFKALAAIPEEFREAFVAPEIQRIRGELLSRHGKLDEAELCFKTAIEVARRRGERSLELRATMSLAQLLARAGRRQEAHTMLEEIYAWFTEGFDTADLKAARLMLDQLES